MASRSAAAALAAVACAWFALGAQQARDSDRASAFIASHRSATPQQVRQVSALLDGASTLNPDRTPQILRGELERIAGHTAQAERILLSVVRQEPDNLEAWFQIGVASVHDPALGRRALRRVAELDPQILTH